MNHSPLDLWLIIFDTVSMGAKHISIDIGESHVKVVDAQIQGNKIHIQNLGITTIEKTFFTTESEKILEEGADKIVKLLDTLKIAQRSAAIVISDGQSFNQIVEMPQLNEKELLSAIRYQADQFIPMPLDEINIDVEVLLEDKKKKKIEALISAAPKKVVEKVQQLIEESGLIPESIETEISAFGRLASALFSQKSETSGVGKMFVNMGTSSTSLYFFDESIGLLSASHSFASGYDLFLKEITVNLNVDIKKASDMLSAFGLTGSAASHDLTNILTPAIKQLMGEIQKFTMLITEKQAGHIKSIHLFNNAVQFPAIEKIIERYFGIPTSIFDLNPYLVQNNIVAANKDQLPYFLPVIGANLR